MPDQTPAPQQLSEILRRMGTILLSEATLDAILDLMTSLARSTLKGADGVGVTLVRDGVVVTAARSDGMVSELDALQYESGEGPCMQSLTDGQPVTSASLREESRWPRFTPRALEKGIGSIHSWPLVVRDNLIGTLNIYSRSVRPWDTEQDDVASMFAKYASIVLANAEAYTSAAKLSAQLQEALVSREIIGEAKGILMEREKCTSEEAFEMLRRMSQHSNVKLKEIAQQLVDSVQRDQRR